MSPEVSLTRIPNFLSAGSPKGLQRLMLKNNISRGIVFSYDIVWVESDKKWYAWFDYDNSQEIFAGAPE